MDNSKVNNNELDIRTKDIGRLNMEKYIKVNLITNKFGPPILLSSYFNIVILSKCTIYQLEQIKYKCTKHKKLSKNMKIITS